MRDQAKCCRNCGARYVKTSSVYCADCLASKASDRQPDWLAFAGQHVQESAAERSHDGEFYRDGGWVE